MKASFKDVLIAGDVGPWVCGSLHLAELNPSRRARLLREQIQVLVDSGVDLIIIETFSDLYEIKEAIIAAKLIR